MTPQERFWAKVDRSGDCWEWTAAIYAGNGYGHFVSQHRAWVAHRYSWTEANGPIPEGMFVLHRCDNRACVRPAHLFLGTKKDNSIDMVRKGRRPHNILTASDIPLIRQRLAAGEGHGAIARDFGVSRPNISRINQGTTWAWLDV